MDGKKFDIITEKEIEEGKATDAYFERTEKILKSKNVNPKVVADIGVDLDRWHIFSGLKDVANLLEGKKIDLYSLPEGTPFKENPVMRIEGNYLEFCRYETSILGFICKATAIASSAMRIKATAGDKTVIEFGTRREHPSTAAMIERSAMIGGIDGISHIAAGETINIQSGGTMPHALIICFRDQQKAWKAYNDVLDKDIPRVALCDTYEDEKLESVKAAETLKEDLDSVRLDTPSSRRGDMKEIVEEVRWELDSRGYEDVEIFVSGGIDKEEIKKLKDVADGFGVGASIASVPPVDFSLDIVEVEGEPAAKRGEKSWKKQIYRKEMEDTLSLENDKQEGEPMLKPIIENGEIIAEFPIEKARERSKQGIKNLKQEDLLKI